VIVPGGIGPRELALIAALAPIAPRGPALVVAVLSRVLMTASDLLWATAGLLVGKLMAKSIHARHAAIKAAAEPVPYTMPSYGSPPPGAAVPPLPAAQRPRTDLGCAPAPDPLPD
jgi:hypothetical protein